MIFLYLVPCLIKINLIQTAKNDVVLQIVKDITEIKYSNAWILSEKKKQIMKYSLHQIETSLQNAFYEQEYFLGFSYPIVNHLLATIFQVYIANSSWFLK